MKSLKSKRNGKKSYIILFIAIIITVFFIVFGLIFKFDFSKIMGNSVVSYYYCEDDTYSLNTNICTKNVYSNYALLGDANLDGSINIKDVSIVQSYLANYVKLDELQMIATDVNKDNVVDNEDVVAIQSKISFKSHNQVGTTSATKIMNQIGKERVCLNNYSYDKSSNSCVKLIKVNALKKDYLKGDLNYDNTLNRDDLELLKTINKNDLSALDKQIADYNNDGKIDLDDIEKLNEDINESVKKDVSVDLNLSNSIDIKNIDKDTLLTYKAKFNIKNNQPIYYVWYDVKSAGNVNVSECKLATNNLEDNYTITATNDNQYVLLNLYTDSSCSELLYEYKKEELKLREVTDNELISMSYEVISPSNLTTTLVNKNTNISLKATFDIKQNQSYYFKWQAFKDEKNYDSSSCLKITDGYVSEQNLVINGKNQYGIFNVYKDSNCSNLIKSYKTDDYEYIADSIKLDLTSARLTVGENLQLNALVETNLDNTSDLIKWTSSNVAVVAVDDKGKLTAKKDGSATITASIGNLTASLSVLVSTPIDDTLKCPKIEYNKSGSTTVMTIKPNNAVEKYDVSLSTNDHVGIYANFVNIKSNIVGNITLNNVYNNAYSNQAKITLYGKNGTKKDCYTPPLTWRWNTISALATCPTINYSFDKMVGANVYTYKLNNTTVNSGSSKMNIEYKLNEDYQYSYYILRSNNQYELIKTYETSSDVVKNSITSKDYNSNIKIVVTDSYGNNISCLTEYINNIKLNRTTVGSTIVYSESTYPAADKNTVLNEMTKLNNESPSYLAASKIFLYTDDTYMKLHGMGSCGQYIVSSNAVVMRPAKTACGGSADSNYFKGAIKHEFGHSIDTMNEHLSGTSLSLGVYNSKDIGYYTSKYENKKLCKNNSYCLRYNGSYSYGKSYWETMADIFSYDSHKYNMTDELLDLRKEMMKTYDNNYKANESKFNEIKESYQ